ncbi:MAG: WG repeat-containing protein [Clostridia bacterium]|nr:WG repeat-containing protein [Clostridia bacterium]
MKGEEKEVHLRNGQIQVYSDICRKINFDNCILVMNNDKQWAVIKITTGQMVTEYKYTRFNDVVLPNLIIKNGLTCSVCDENCKWGALNSKGNEIIECKYDICKVITPDYAIIGMGKNYGVLNKKAEPIIPINYKNIIQEVFKGFFIVSQEDGDGIIDTKGNIIVPCLYKELYLGDKENWLVKDSKNNYFFYDKNGSLLNQDINVISCYKNEEDEEIFSPINVFKKIVKS